MSGAVVRRATSIGIHGYGATAVPVEGDPGPYRDLPFVPERVRAVAAALKRVAYSTRRHGLDRGLTAATAASRVRKAFGGTAEDVLIVHVVGHAKMLDESLYVVGADGRWLPGTEVEQWIKDIEHDPDPPFVLFLLDVCHAGVAATLGWQLRRAGGPGRAWVIAASEIRENAFAGCFSQAVANFLNRLSTGRIDIFPSYRHVPYAAMIEYLRSETAAVARERGLPEQNVRGTPIDGEPDLPFFVNPCASQDGAAWAGRRTDRLARPFLDEVADDLHFRQRASGLLPDRPGTMGYFTGRESELRTLVDWLDTGDGDGIVLVTGSPGAGKSALLGVLVCAAHRQLRDETEPIWHGLAVRPARNPGLAAVHARERTVDAVVASLVRQWELGPDPENWTVDRLLAAVLARPAPPTLIIDALDEANVPDGLMTELLFPLTRSRPDGRPACRLLVGARDDTQLRPLRDLAAGEGRVVDLDRTPPDELRSDLKRYVQTLLSREPQYDDAGHRDVVEAFAGAVADTLVPEDGDDGRARGEFLIAALFTHAFVRATAKTPVNDAPAAGEHGRRVPRTLPDLLALDLRGRAGGASRLRRLLVAVAHARGDGMPLELLEPVCAALARAAGLSRVPNLRQIRNDLASLRFYLRLAPESTDGTTLYRLFHNNLAEELAGDAGGHVLAALLSAVPRHDGRPVWARAAPYLVRHLAQHADAPALDVLLTDPDFVARAEPSTLIVELDRAESATARRIATVYRTSAHRHGLVGPDERRQILMIDALRHGFADLAGLLAAGGRWRPVWATGSQANAAVTANLLGHRGRVHGIATVAQGGRTWAVSTGTDGTVRAWDLRRGTAVGRAWQTSATWNQFAAGAVVANRPLAVVNVDDRVLQAYDVETGDAVGAPLPHRSAITALAVSGGYAMSSTVAGTAHRWNLESGAPQEFDTLGRCTAITGADGFSLHLADGTVVEEAEPGGAAPGLRELLGPLPDDAEVTAAAETVVNGRRVVVSGTADGAVIVRHPGDGRRRDRTLGHHRGRVNAAACTTIDRRPYAITGGDDGILRIWALTAGDPTYVVVGHSGNAVKGLACARVGDRPVAVLGSTDATIRVVALREARTARRSPTGHTAWTNGVGLLDSFAVTASSDGTAMVWDIRSGRRRRVLDGHHGGVFAVACAGTRDGPVAITGGNDGAAIVWDLRSGGQRQLLAGHAGGVFGLATTVVEGVPLVVTGSNDGTAQAWDLRDGRRYGPVLTEHGGGVNALACGRVGGRQVVVTAADDGAARVWDLRDGSLTAVLGEHGAWMHAVACAEGAGGTPLVLTGDTEGRLHWWDPATAGRAAPAIRAHEGPIYGLAAARLEGRPAIFTAGHDHVVRAWDLVSRRQLAAIAMPYAVSALAVSRDGMVVAGSECEVVALRLPAA
ncbi:AAA family ATPase [Actinoplanes sp. NPDC049118]|uniref:AAA family ATPase n=1 Tax=Actinoplanes sp. NPDC049118 TaxID=3155769 RepID=UPI00340267F9